MYVPLSSVQDKTKNLKRVYLIQTNKKQIQGPKEKWETTGKSGESTGRSQNISLINCTTFHIRGALSWHSYVIMYFLCIKVYSFIYVWLVWNNADVKINFIIQFYLFIIYWTIVDYYICAFIICARQNKESEKGLLNTNKQKTNTRT
jgi:hypothetical protein